MWLPSGLVEVLIKECGCNISGTWLAGVVLVIAGNLEYVIVIYWSFLYGYFTTNPVQIRTETFFQNCN